jgi:hypothetical protein
MKRKAPAASAAPAPAAPPEPEAECGFTPPEFDPAEYRWVPVRRQPRHDGWTEEKQRRFIEVLADTGLVGLAAKEVGMTRTSAYRLRRAPYAAAFARAWDVARERAGALIEDIAFERAIEGAEQEVYDGYGEMKGSRTVHNDRLLTFLLRHLKPERYSREARAALAQAHFGGGGHGGAAARGGPARELPAPEVAGSGAREGTLDEALRAMEPPLPAPPEQLLDPEQLENDLLTAEAADGKLPHFFAEQRAPKSPEQLRIEENSARYERGRQTDALLGPNESPSEAEYEDWCLYIDPSQGLEKRKKRRPPRGSRA